MATHPGLALPIGDVFIPLRYDNTVGYLDLQGNRLKIPNDEQLLVVVNLGFQKEKIFSAIFVDGEFRAGLFLKTYQQPWRIKAVKRVGQKIDTLKIPVAPPKIKNDVLIYGTLPYPRVYEDITEEGGYEQPIIIYGSSVEEQYLAASIRMMDAATKHQEEMREIKEKYSHRILIIKDLDKFLKNFLVGLLCLLLFAFYFL